MGVLNAFNSKQKYLIWRWLSISWTKYSNLICTAQCVNFVILLSPEKFFHENELQKLQIPVFLKWYLWVLLLDVEMNTKSKEWSIDLKKQYRFDIFQIDAVTTKWILVEFGQLWSEIIHCIHHLSQLSQVILVLWTL